MITVKKIHKSFGAKKVLDNINFSIKKGEIIALLGPNGAGKTTLMRIMTGYLSSSGEDGEVLVFGHNINTEREKVLRNIGYVPENGPLYSEMSVYEFLKFAANIRGIKGKEFEDNFKDAVKKMSLEDVVNQKIETLSKGFKRRVGVASCIIHKPNVLILDEPTEGLDPNQKIEAREFIKSYGKKGIVIISTHMLEDVEAVATRVILLNEGKVVIDTTPKELKRVSARGDIAEAFHKLTKE